jgi:hypothetical protein
MDGINVAIVSSIPCKMELRTMTSFMELNFKDIDERMDVVYCIEKESLLLSITVVVTRIEHVTEISESLSQWMRFIASSASESFKDV